VNVLRSAPDPQPAFTDRVVIVPQKEVNVSSEGGELPAVVEADCAGADHGNAKVWKPMT
jgi:hypothetical protein